MLLAKKDQHLPTRFVCVDIGEPEAAVMHPVTSEMPKPLARRNPIELPVALGQANQVRRSFRSGQLERNTFALRDTGLRLERFRMFCVFAKFQEHGCFLCWDHTSGGSCLLFKRLPCRNLPICNHTLQFKHIRLYPIIFGIFLLLPCSATFGCTQPCSVIQPCSAIWLEAKGLGNRTCRTTLKDLSYPWTVSGPPVEGGHDAPLLTRPLL